ncbi:AmmeMemoRadiSam system protein B [soil metagenome]
MSRIRLPAVAGTFYPADAESLRGVVRDLLAGVGGSISTDVPKAIIAPHAGYRYSGPIAASAMALLRPGRESIRRVILLGTAHSRLEGIATTSVDKFATPLGVVPVDRGALAEVDGLPVLVPHDDAHAADHALEVQLPFLQELLDTFRVVPLLVGRCRPEAVAEVIDRLWGGRETVLLISSDLSHYLDDESARRRDRATADSILSFDVEQLGPEAACGHRAIAGLLLSARRHGLKAELVDLRNSGDTSGRRDRVVGYGAFAFRARPLEAGLSG